MSVKTETCFTVQCDGCGRQGEHYDGYTPHYPDAARARDEARDAYEWWSDGQQDFCDECKTQPHEFVPQPPSGDWSCARCGEDGDEHQSGGAS